MNISINWLKDYVDIEETPQELADMLTMAGLEAASITELGEGCDDIVVAQILKKEQHPNADRLSLCQVTDGEETYPIVCGATNMVEGDKVALARVGSVLPGNFKIKKAKLRGVESHGMMCSERELGLSDVHAGIIVLPGDTPVGTKLTDVLGLPDTVIEVEITPNRPDWLSVIGVAREICANTGRKLKMPPIELSEGEEAISDMASVEINATDLCHRYTARFIKGVKVGPSPLWMQNRLKAAGVRPISNVVDVTNYVLMELGHPLHAFDFNKLRGGKIIVQRAKEGEKFTTLDEQARILSADNLMICDGEGSVGVAGVMGGLNSEVSEETVDVLLEAAYFFPPNIRSTAKALGLSTEASYRFERGADIDGLVTALERAARLIVETSGGTVLKGMIDNYPNPHEKKKITLRVPRILKVLGLEVASERAVKCLSDLGIEVVEADENRIVIEAPTHRVDIEREIDLIEEIARIVGYNDIPSTLPRISIQPGVPAGDRPLYEKCRDLLAAAGLSEIVTYSFIDPEDDNRIGLSEDSPLRAKVKIQNPLGVETSVLRTTLLPSLLRVAGNNVRRGNKDLKLFEVGKTFHPVSGAPLPEEHIRMAGLLTGSREPLTWWAKQDRLDFFDGKGVVERVFSALGVSGVSYSKDDEISFLQPGRAAAISAGGATLGWLGEIHPDLLDQYELTGPVVAFELSLQEAVKAISEVGNFPGLAKFPPSERDLALLTREDLTFQEVKETILSLNLELLKSVVLFDLYKGKNIPEGMQSIAIRITYRSGERTLTEEEVAEMQEKVVAELSGKLGARLRD